jgi:hypothetical protein
MERYLNLSGCSGVEAFEIRKDYIKVKFANNPQIYTYSYTSAKQHNVEQMKILASNGRGLNSYITKNVRYKYVRSD